MKELERILYEAGASLVGYADLHALPHDARKGLPRGIAIGIALPPEIVADIPTGPHMAYIDEYDRLNAKLDEICLLASQYLTEKGYETIPQTVGAVNAQRRNHPKGYADIPHKTVAALAGLGWITKSSLLVTERYGSALRLTSILTDAPVETKPVPYHCLCGDCRVCVDACPGNAIRNVTWSIYADRDDLIDYSACRATVTSRGKKLGKDHAACGICMAVCPYTRKYVK